jgi:exonuclease SbcC
MPAALAAARAAVEKRATLRERAVALEAEAAKVPTLNGAVAGKKAVLHEADLDVTAASQGIADMPALEHAFQAANVAVGQARATLEQAAADFTRATLQAEQLHALEAETAAMRADIGQRQGRLDVLKLAERAFGRDGIPVLIAESVIPFLETEMNWALEQMPTAAGTVFRTTWRTQKEQKTVAHMKETLEIVVHAPDCDQPFESLSGGEESRACLAIGYALSALIARAGGSRLLVVDELPFLDGLGDEALVALLNATAERGSFSTILVVSHSPNVRDSFDSVLQFEQTDLRCRLITSDVPAAVSA